MPKIANENIGECPCPFVGCDRVAHIRRQKNHENGALFINCGTHRQRPSASLDAYIEEKGTFYDALGKVQGPAPGQGQGKEQTPGDGEEKPATARGGQEQGKPQTGGFFGWLNNWDL